MIIRLLCIPLLVYISVVKTANGMLIRRGNGETLCVQISLQSSAASQLQEGFLVVLYQILYISIRCFVIYLLFFFYCLHIPIKTKSLIIVVISCIYMKTNLCFLKAFNLADYTQEILIFLYNFNSTFRGFSPSLSKQAAWWCTDRHGTGETGKSSTSLSAGRESDPGTLPPARPNFLTVPLPMGLWGPFLINPPQYPNSCKCLLNYIQ